MSNARNLARLLPDSSGKIQLPSQVAGVLPDANAPSGSVLQVVSFSGANLTSTSSFTFIDLNYKVTITPISSSSKILIIANLHTVVSANGRQPVLTLYRNSTNLGTSNYGMGNTYTSAGGYIEGQVSLNYVDTPNTTTPVVYGLYGRDAASLGAQFGDSARLCTITALEIAA